MKINVSQKIILLVYSFLFIYFSIIHVPFKTNYPNEIKYDTLFSDSSNLDVSRLVLIIFTISILTSVVFLLFRNVIISFNAKTIFKKRRKTIIIGAIVLVLVITFTINSYQNKKNDLKIVSPTNSTTMTKDSTSETKDSTSSGPSASEIKKEETCTIENAVENFQSYMKFYYPDWKIYGKPVVRETFDCTYQVQFTTMDPNIRYQKEVIIVEISFNYDYTRYTFRTVRGTLY
jgi:hypothetical protein